MSRVLSTLLTIALTAPIALGIGAVGLQAQQPQGQPGDLVWQLAPNGVLADQRIRDALVILTDSDSVPVPGGSLVYFSDLITDDRSQVELLLAAAGFGQPAEQLREARRCRFWAPADSEPAFVSGLTLGRRLANGLAEIGIVIQPCERTHDADEADILVWPYGEDHGYPPGVYFPDASSFLEAVPSGQPEPPGISAPGTGDAGLKAETP